MESNPNTIAVAKTKVHAPASDTAAVATIAADADEYWAVDWIAISYEGTAITGNLLVAIGGTTYLNLDIDGATYVDRFLAFSPPMSSSAKNEAVVVTLADGGTGVTGKVNVGYR